MSRMKQVYDYLLEAIVSNKIPPGTPIVETEISNELNMSRTPIREALKELEAEGLVNRYPSIGTVVSHITPHDVEEIFDLRILLETFALQLSWDKITEEEIEELEKLFINVDLNGPKDVYHMADRQLHALIVNKSGNRRLKKTLDLFNSQIERFRRVAAFSSGRLDTSKKEHLDILRYLKERNLNACEESLRQHLISVKKSTYEVAKLFAMQSENK